MEIWKPLVGFETLYEVSNHGNVKSLDRVTIVKYADGRVMHKRYKGRSIKTPLLNVGYAHFRAWLNGVGYQITVHRAVAQAFVKNEHNKPDVNHINGIKSDNLYSNLEWCTHQENMIHANKTGLRKPGNLDKIGSLSPNAKVVLQFTKSGEFVKRWLCAVDVKNELGFSAQNISTCALGKVKSASGFVWEYE